MKGVQLTVMAAAAILVTLVSSAIAMDMDMDMSEEKGTCDHEHMPSVPTSEWSKLAPGTWYATRISSAQSPTAKFLNGLSHTITQVTINPDIHGNEAKYSIFKTTQKTAIGTCKTATTMCEEIQGFACAGPYNAVFVSEAMAALANMTSGYYINHEHTVMLGTDFNTTMVLMLHKFVEGEMMPVWTEIQVLVNGGDSDVMPTPNPETIQQALGFCPSLADLDSDKAYVKLQAPFSCWFHHGK